jgi:glyoxylase I family protein
MARRILDHASLRIRDLDRSRQFYEAVLGLTVAPRPDLGVAGIWYALGDGQLHLIQRDPTLSGAIDPTDAHVAIRVDDLDAMRRQLKAAGIEMLDFGGGQLWVRDPDGNTVELRAAAAPSA